ncbi:unnamed protein product, partial [Agarophyton chilense]
AASAYVPAPPPSSSASASASASCSQRVAISHHTHARLKHVAARRFRGVGSISKLAAIVLDNYLAHMERFYFGRARVTSCAPVPSQCRDFDAVLFDMDGVLCDSELPSRHAAVAVFRRHYHIDVRPDDFAPFTGTGEANFLAGVAAVYKVAHFDPDDAKRHFFDMYINHGYVQQLSPFPGVHGLVERVKQLGLKVAVASSADRVKVDANLDAIGLPPQTFDHVTSGDQLVRKKPAPDVFLQTAAALSVPPARCIVIEDAVAGVLAAKAAAMRCIAVSTSLSADQLRDAGADVVRPQPALIELLDLFGRDVFAAPQ